MAAKGTKRGRGRAKSTEPEAEPTTSPEPTTSTEAPQPDQDEASAEGAAEGETQPGTKPSAQAPEDETESIGPPEPAGPTGTPPTWSVSNLVVAGLAAVLMSVIVAVVVVYATAADTDRQDQQAQRLDGLATHSQTQSSRLDAAEGAIDGLRSDVGQVTAAVNDLQSTAEANRQNLEQMAASIEGLRGAVSVPSNGAAGEAVTELQDTTQSLDERLARLEQDAGLEDVTGRIARLEEEIAGLREQTAASVEQAQSATALGRAYAALVQRISAGEPFAEELEAVTAELPGAPGLETLRPIAGEGAPTIAQLQAGLDRIATEVPGEESDEAPDADGFWQTMGERIENMVTVRRADEAEAPAALDRAREALQRGDVEGAISEVEQVSGAAPAEIEAWLADARMRRDVQAGLDELSDAVLRQFAGRQ